MSSSRSKWRAAAAAAAAAAAGAGLTDVLGKLPCSFNSGQF